MKREDSVSLSQKEQKRLLVIAEVEAGKRPVAEAAALLHLSERQLRRLRRGYQEQGVSALAHANRGRPAQNRLPEAQRQRIIDLSSGKYAACNDTHLRELLALHEGILVGRSTLQRIRRQAGQKPKQKRRPPRHRSRRDRRPQEGMLLQVDGSLHPWFGPEQGPCTLLAAIDDATGKVVAAVFREQEDAQGYFLLVKQVVTAEGIPYDLYHDRHSIFQVNPRLNQSIEEQLSGEPAQTQFGRALEELGIGSIAAHSPEAKGRVERLWRTLQDRLVVELALAGITNITAGNRFLDAYLERFNACFAQEPEEPGLAYRPLDRALDLNRVLSFRYQRSVARDNTVSLEGRLIQIPPGPRRRSYFAARVWVHELLDGSLAVWYQDRWLVRGASGETDARVRARKRRPGQLEGGAEALPLPLPPEQPEVIATPRPTVSKPAAGHPWRAAVVNLPRTKSLSS